MKNIQEINGASGETEGGTICFENTGNYCRTIWILEYPPYGTGEIEYVGMNDAMGELTIYSDTSDWIWWDQQ